MEDGPAWGWAGFEAGRPRIGCRAFDAATFKKIMAAAQRTKAKAASAKKKAKATKKR
jgi:hypothetical protein